MNYCDLIDLKYINPTNGLLTHSIFEEKKSIQNKKHKTTLRALRKYRNTKNIVNTYLW